MAATSIPTVLNSWKEIANYLGRGVRTVQRYEQQANLPVRRVGGKSRNSVIALPKDLDVWLRQSCASEARLTGIQSARGRMALQIHQETISSLNTNLRALMELIAEGQAIGGSPRADEG